MAISWDSFDKIWASTSPLTPYSFSDPNYAQGWNFVGSTPPARQMWDSIQKQNDEKFKYLRDNFGTPNIVTQVSQMTDTDKVYVYMGSEAGWNNGHWYYYDEGTSSWADGGVYNSVAFVTDTTLSIAGQPADAKATGDAIALKPNVDPTLTVGGAAADAKVTGEVRNALNTLCGDTYPKIGGTWFFASANFSLNDQWADSNSTRYYIDIPANTSFTIKVEADSNIFSSFLLYLLDDNNTNHLYKNTNQNVNTNIDILVNYNIVAVNIVYVPNRITADIKYVFSKTYNSTFASVTDFDNATKTKIESTDITWQQGAYINPTNGNIGYSASWDATSYITVFGVNSIVIAISNSSSSVGCAFYNDAHEYISGEALVYDSSVSVKEFDVSVPSNAKYCRFGCFASTRSLSYAILLYTMPTLAKKVDDVTDGDLVYNSQWQYAMDKILCIGDSLTSGAYYDGSTFNGASIAQNYPYFIGRMLNTEATNAGVSGMNVTEWLTNEYSKYTYTDYNTIIIWLGSNGGLLKDLPENPTAGQTLAHNNYVSYRQLISNIQGANSNALIIMCKIYFTNYWVDISNEALESIAKEYGCPLVDLSDLNADNYPELRDVNVNRYHLFKCGNIVVASRIISEMKKWFASEPQRCEFGLSNRVN